MKVRGTVGETHTAGVRGDTHSRCLLSARLLKHVMHLEHGRNSGCLLRAAKRVLQEKKTLVQLGQ